MRKIIVREGEGGEHTSVDSPRYQERERTMTIGIKREERF